MGANLPAKMYKKKNPTETRLVFDISATDQTFFIDVAAALSAINRKAFRQGLYYYINSFEVENAEDGYVELKVAPDTWMTKNAYKRGLRKYYENYAESDTPRPKYHDFKIYLDSTHRDHDNGTPNYTQGGTPTYGFYRPSLGGAIGNMSVLSLDEWEYSKYVSHENTTTGTPFQFDIHLIGNHIGTAPGYTSVGLIHSYHKSRPEPDQSGEPILPSGHADDPLNNLMESAADDVVQAKASNLDNDNDRTPYNADYYTGESDNGLTILRRLATGANSNGRVHEIAGACVPFGLIRVDASYSSSWRLIINVASGTYNGVYAERV